MTKEEKAKCILERGGECVGFSCESTQHNVCPCFIVCRDGTGSKADRIAVCKAFLNTTEPSPKTLRDEFAMAVLSGMFAGGANWHDLESNAEVAYRQADAMMAERDRVKE